MRDSSTPSDGSETITVTKRSAMIALGAGILAIALVAGVAITALARTTGGPEPANAAATMSEGEKPGDETDSEKDAGKDEKKKGKDSKKKDSDKAKKSDGEAKDSKKSGKSDKGEKKSPTKVKAAAPSTSTPSGGSSKDSSSKSGSSSKSEKTSSKPSSKSSTSKKSDPASKSSTQSSTPIPAVEAASGAADPATSTDDATVPTSTSEAQAAGEDFVVTSPEPTVDELDSLVQFLLTTEASDEAKSRSLENGMLTVGLPQFFAGLGVGDDPAGEAQVVGPLERSGDSITATLKYSAEGQTRLSTPVVFTNTDGAWKLSAQSLCAAAEGAGSPVGC